MRQWQPAQADLRSVSGSENQTFAIYIYKFNGRSYRGTRVSVTHFKNNIGSYHKDLQNRLRLQQDSGESLPIWVNPLNPGEAMIDRDMPWGIFAFISVFCSIFIFPGLRVLYFSIKPNKKKLRV